MTLRWRRRLPNVASVDAMVFFPVMATPDRPEGHTLYAMLLDAEPTSVCLRFEGRDLSYGDLRTRVDHLASGLAAIGLSRGDVVGIWLPTTPDWVVAMFACARIGAKVLSLNLRLSGHEINSLVQRSDCKALFYCPEYRGKSAAPTLEQLGACASLRILVASAGDPLALDGDSVSHYRMGSLEGANAFKGEPGRPNDSCILLSSSGTTSKPKLIVHAQQGVVRHMRDIANGFGITSASRTVLAIPCSGAFGFTVLMTAVRAGAAVSMMENFVPAECAGLLNAHRITHLFGTNDQLHKMLAAMPPDWRLPDLKVFGHANFTPGLSELPAHADAHGIRMNGCYGLSETLAFFATQPLDASLERRALSGGVPLCLQARVRVRSLATGELLAPGKTGELELYTPDLMIGYLDDPAATSAAIGEDGWLRTGDLAYLTDDGGFIYLARTGDVLRIGGYLVNALEIEEAILVDPLVRACQVVEVRVGHDVRPVGFVIGHPNYLHDEAGLIAACRSRMAIYKVPIRVFEVACFPTVASPNGEKVRKAELREMATRWLNAGDAST